MDARAILPFPEFPPELTSMILQRLDYITQEKARRVCSQWMSEISKIDRRKNILVLEGSLARTLYAKDKLHLAPPNEETTSVFYRGADRRDDFDGTVVEKFISKNAEEYVEKHPNLKQIVMKDIQILVGFPQFLAGTDIILVLKNPKIRLLYGEVAIGGPSAVSGAHLYVSVPDFTVQNAVPSQTEISAMMESSLSPLAVSEEDAVLQFFSRLKKQWLGPMLHSLEQRPSVNTPTRQELRSFKLYVQHLLHHWATNASFHVSYQ